MHVSEEQGSQYKHKHELIGSTEIEEIQTMKSELFYFGRRVKYQNYMFTKKLRADAIRGTFSRISFGIFSLAFKIQNIKIRRSLILSVFYMDVKLRFRSKGRIICT
jgi:hypothetical protein